MEKATRQSWLLNPMSQDNLTVDVLWKFAADDYHKIEMGYVPNDFPGDRYFMFMEDNIFYIGMTNGICTHILWFRQSGNDYEVYKIQMARNRYYEREKQIKNELGTIEMIFHDTLRAIVQKG